MKKIGIFIVSDSRVYPPTINAANILAERGNEVIIFDISSTFTKDRININKSIKVYNLGKQRTGIKNFLQYLFLPIRLIYLVKKHKLNWLFSYDAYSVFPAFCACLFNKKTKWLYHQHDFWEGPIGLFQNVLYELEYRLVPKADFISFPQINRAKLFKERTQMKQTPLIVFNGPRKGWVLDNQKVNSKILDLKENGFKLLIYQGGISSYFGLEKLIEAVSLVNISLKLIILGKELEKDYVQKLKNKSKQLFIENRIIFWDEYVKYDDLPGITAFCDLGVTKLTNPNGNAPINDRFLAGASNKIIEYLASGLPILASDSLDNRVFMGENDMGILCDVTSVNAIAKAISKVLEDKQLLQRISQSNRELFYQKYCFDVQFEKILKVLN